MPRLDPIYRRQSGERARLLERKLNIIEEEFSTSSKILVGGVVGYIETGNIGPVNQAIKQTTYSLAKTFEETIHYSLLDAAVMAQDHIVGLGGAAYAGTGIDMTALGVALGNVPESVVQAAYARIWSDGFRLSDRIWNMEAALRTQLQGILTTGISQGESVATLAKDISAAYDQVQKWQAFRLARTETLGAYRTGYVEAGNSKDYVLGYDWVLSNACNNCDDCITLSMRSPFYEKDQVPSEAETHPNCACDIQAVLMGSQEFIGYLKDKYEL